MTNSNSLQKCNVFEPSLHNGVKCIQSTRPEDQGTVRQIWFTSKLLCEIFDVSRKTLEDNIKSLSDDGEFSMADFRHTEKITASDGKTYQTTLFNLEVLNKLGMCCFRGNQKAREIRNKFNDVLVKEETTKTTLPTLSKEDQLFLNIIHTNSQEQTALALNEYKIYRDEREQEIAFERDEAIRTKAFISSKRESTAMLTARTEKAKRIAIEERIGEGMKWMSSAQLIKNYNIRDENGNLMKSGTLTKVLKKRNCKWRESDVPDASGYHYTIFWVADVVETLKLN